MEYHWLALFIKSKLDESLKISEVSYIQILVNKDSGCLVVSYYLLFVLGDLY